MRKFIIFFTTFSFCLLFCVQMTIGHEFRIKGNHRPSAHNKEQLYHGKSLKTNNTEEFNVNSNIMLLKQKTGVKKLCKDLVSKARINSNEGFQGKTTEELIIFLNTENALPGKTDSIVNRNFPTNDFSFRNSLINIVTFLGLPTINNNSISILNLMAFNGLPILSTDPLSIAHLVSRVSLTVLFWGAPVFSAAGSAGLTFAFNKITDHKQDIKYQQKKRDDKIYKDIYKYCAFKDKNKLSPSNWSVNINAINDSDISTSEFQNRVSQSYISQHSLTMLESRFAELTQRQ